MWAGIKKRLVPILIALGLVALLVYQLTAAGGVECNVCVVFKERRQCATAKAATEAAAREEAHRSACSRISSGVTEAFACPNVAPEQVTCAKK